MANQIRIHTSCEIVHDVGSDAGTQQGIDYISKQLDGNADYRSWGGNYNIATAYTDADVCYWKNATISATSADALEDSGWTEDSAVTDGTIPDNIYVVAVEYVKERGTVGGVSVTISGEVFAVLLIGESVVIPISSNNANTAVKIHAAVYDDGTNEAIVNVMIAGT